MGKKVSARIKNRIKAQFARSISSLEKTVRNSSSNYRFTSSNESPASSTGAVKEKRSK
jgi:hypothetical protein